MDESFAPADLLSAGELRVLSERRDGPGLLRAGAQLALFGLSAALAFGGETPVWPALVLCGLVQGTMFGGAHEMVHGTAFRSRGLNRVIGAVFIGVCLMAPTWFRAFHFTHHRHTHIPGKDPEAPIAAIVGWPRFRALTLLLLTGQPYLWARLGHTLALVLGAPKPLREAVMPFLSEADRPRAVRQARVLVAVHAAIVALGWMGLPALRWWPLTWVFAHLIQGPWLLVEHTGLPSEGSIFARTRSLRLGAFARFWTWNMSFHAEHHAWPSVPFFQLPALHERVKGGLVHRAPGYLSVLLQGLRIV